MKKYSSLGELLIDYRNLYNISQAELAARLEVDSRTIGRWEKNETLVKPEKEEELADETFIPYQVIRNLNAMVAIPTFYDFRLRKYSLSEMSNKMPDASWFKDQIEITTDRLRAIEYDSDVESILRYTQFEYHSDKPISKQLILEAARRLPEINLIIFDKSGYYSGHAVILPIGYSTYQKLRNRKMTKEEITIDDLVDYKNETTPVFHTYDIAADCNENLFYLIGAIFRFFRDLPTKDYIYSALTTRYDSYEINEKIGIKIVWKETEEEESPEQKKHLRFYEGNFNAFLGK